MCARSLPDAPATLSASANSPEKACTLWFEGVKETYREVQIVWRGDKLFFFRYHLFFSLSLHIFFARIRSMLSFVKYVV